MASPGSSRAERGFRRPERRREERARALPAEGSHVARSRSSPANDSAGPRRPPTPGTSNTVFRRAPHHLPSGAPELPSLARCPQHSRPRGARAPFRRASAGPRLGSASHRKHRRTSRVEPPASRDTRGVVRFWSVAQQGLGAEPRRSDFFANERPGLGAEHVQLSPTCRSASPRREEGSIAKRARLVPGLDTECLRHESDRRGRAWPRAAQTYHWATWLGAWRSFPWFEPS